MSVTSILGPYGRIAQFWPEFESRPEQLQFAKSVAQALDTNTHLIAEAGTGVGKSFGYLVPAILAILAKKKKHIVISTHTINLQEQIVQKDIPFLQDIFPEGFESILVKGRGNYLSKRRLRVARQRQMSLVSDAKYGEQLLQIERWSKKTTVGSRSELPVIPPRAVWEDVESDSGNCLGRKCPDYDECFYFRSRKGLRSANILIVNHSLFFADLALRRGDSKLLPDYDAVIFDEAHTVEDVASDHLGIQVNQSSIEYLLNKLHNPRQRKGLLTSFGSTESILQVERTRQACDQFFANIRGWQNAQAKSNGRVRQANITNNDIAEQMRILSGHIIEASQDFDEEEASEFRSLAERCTQHSGAIDQWLAQSLPEQIYWVESRQETVPRTNLISAPLHVGPTLKKELFNICPTVIFTSATISAGGSNGFEMPKRQLGLDLCDTLAVGSPFDYKKQVELHLFRQLPDPASNPRERSRYFGISDSTLSS